MEFVNLNLTKKYLKELEINICKNHLEFRKKVDKLLINSNFVINFSPEKQPPFPISLGTFFVNKRPYDNLVKDLKLFISACLKVRKEYFSGNEEMKKIIRVDPREEDLFSKEEIDLDTFGALRFDLHVTNEGPKICELNSDNPDAIFLLQDSMKSFYEKILPKKYKSLVIPPADCKNELLKSIIDRYEKVESIGILGPIKEIKLFEYEKQNDFFKTKNFKSNFGSLKDLEFSEEELKLKKEKIDIIRRITEISYYTENFGLSKLILNVLDRNQVKLYNAFKDRILGYKIVLAILSNPKYDHMFNLEEVKALRKVVPWTRVCEDSLATNLDGEVVNLKNFVLKNKEKLVLKPAGETAAKGVTIGCEIEDKDWENAVEEAFNDKKQWIAQKVLKPIQTPILIDGSDGVEIKNMNADFSIMGFYRKRGLRCYPSCSRYNSKLMSNILSGGKMLFPFLLSENQ